MGGEDFVIRGGGCNITKSSNNAQCRQHQRRTRTLECVLTRRHIGGRRRWREGREGGPSGHRGVAAKSGAQGCSTDQKLQGLPPPAAGASHSTGEASRPGPFRWPSPTFIPRRRLMEELDPDQCTQRSDCPSLPFPQASRGGRAAGGGGDGGGGGGGLGAARSLATESSTLPLSQPASDSCACLSRRCRHGGQAAGDRSGEKTAVICL